MVNMFKGHVKSVLSSNALGPVTELLPVLERYDEDDAMKEILTRLAALRKKRHEVSDLINGTRGEDCMDSDGAVHSSTHS